MRLDCSFALILGLLVGCSEPQSVQVENPPQTPQFTGSESCRSCHNGEFELWSASHHANAMAHATPDSVLGDFSVGEFRHQQTTARFERIDDRYYVSIDNAEGVVEQFQIAYTFGREPLQQYLVEFEDGRLQTLPVAWDSRPEDSGGQRWFHIYPDEAIDSDDPLHWTGREQNWNFMCAECHSTNLRKNYDAANDTYSTQWSEINVACEACHGPSSIHVQQAEALNFDSRFGLTIDLDDKGRATWEMRPDTGIASRSEFRITAPQQPESCGRCHSRRAAISDQYTYADSLLANHALSLLEDRLYFPDGQVREEVYVYGSFVQSRMYQAGVSCSDCHDPHSGSLLTGSDPDRICSTCHLPERFASQEHHRHGAAAPACVDCHMPARTYMVVDDRRDHSFRVPRPDLTIATGSPNACNQCHQDESATWSAAAIESWYGPPDAGHFALAFHGVRSHAADANAKLFAVIGDALTPGIVRASALAELRPPLSSAQMRSVRAQTEDADPLVRIGALRAMAAVAPESQIEWAGALLADARLAVRIEAARLLSPLRTRLPPPLAASFARAEFELRTSHEVNFDRPESRASLAALAADAGDLEQAEALFLDVLDMEPAYSGARINLVDLYRRQGREEQAESLLHAGIELTPIDAPLHHALGLLYVRTGRTDEALAELRKAVQLAPTNPRFAYVFAVALNSLGDTGAALQALRRAAADFPADFDIRWALATILRDQARSAEAREIAEDLATRYPDLAQVRELLRSL